MKEEGKGVLEEFLRDERPIFIELPGFTRSWMALELGDDDLQALQEAILEGAKSLSGGTWHRGTAEDPLCPSGRKTWQEILLPRLLRLLPG